MSATFRPDDHASPREPVRAEHREWRLRAATLTDGDSPWQPTIQVQGPLGSPAWWLAHAHGFLVDDEVEQPVGVVEDVRFDHDAKRACALIVAQGWGHRWLVIPIDAVTEIAPAERRLTVACPPDLDRWRQEGEHQPPSLLRRLRGALRVMRRLVPGLR